MDVDAGVVITDQCRGSGVDAHPNLHRRAIRPICAVEGLLGLDGAPDGFAGLGEGREQAIAFAAEDRTAVPIDRLLCDLAVCGKELRIVGPDPFEQTRGSFDVQKEKRDRSAGKRHVLLSWRPMNSRTRLQASADSRENRSCCRSKKEWGASE